MRCPQFDLFVPTHDIALTPPEHLPHSTAWSILILRSTNLQTGQDNNPARMQRQKNVGYTEDDLYTDEEDYLEEGADEQGYTAEDREKLSTLTPVVRAEMEESGLQVDNSVIEEALWHYFWDVGKSVTYLKNSRTPRTAQSEPQAKKGKSMSKFDEAAQKSAEKASKLSPYIPTVWNTTPEQTGVHNTRGGHYSARLSGTVADGVPQAHAVSAKEWFKDTPWTRLDPSIVGQLVPAMPGPPRPRLLGGSSKLAKLAEERRRKAAASQTTQPAPVDSLTSLDRLSIAQDSKENATPLAISEPKRYPIRRKRSPTPPPKEPTPPPEEPKEQLPDLRSSPTAFARTLYQRSVQPSGAVTMALDDLIGSTSRSNPFEGPSPDDTVMKAQSQSKGLKK